MTRRIVEDPKARRIHMSEASEEIARLLRQIAGDVERLGQLAASEEAIGEDELCEIANVYLALTSAIGPIAGGSQAVSRLLREQPSARPSTKS